jgi:radical SAM superfamily enzyme YgiQ (UPF0313 family)
MAKYRASLAQISNSFSNQNYLPYSAGILAAYARKYLKDTDKFDFDLSVYKRTSVREAVDSLLSADIAFFSVYTWNVNLSLAIAEELKKVRPEALTVFGGPEVPRLGAAEFLRKNPQADLLVFGEGERPFLRILETFPSRDFGGVPSAGYMDGAEYKSTPTAARIDDLREVPSPYTSGVFAPLMEAHPDENWVALWETNRGCPFSCAYCVWGSYEQNKVCLRDIKELKKELDWFSQNRIEFIFCCDANFGIASRDLDITRMVALNKKKYGYPRAFSVQNTKNSTSAIYDIYRIMSDAGLNKGVSLALQSVNPDTLESVKRRNIATDTFYELQKLFNDAGIESFTDVILPLPLETYDTFCDGVAAIVENGQHGRIQFNNLSILTNSEMADEAYKKKYGLKTVEIKLVNIHGSLINDEVPETQRLVTATSSMPRGEWVRARVFAWMTSLLYFDKILQIPIAVAHSVYGAGYREMIEAFINASADYTETARLRDFFTAKAESIQNGDAEFCESPQRLNIWWPADEIAFIELCAGGKLGSFYAEAEKILGGLLKSPGRSGFEGVMGDSVGLNAKLLKMPGNNTDMDIELSYNIPEVYAAAVGGGKTEIAQGRFMYTVDRTTVKWNSWDDWCREVVWYGYKRGAYLYPCRKKN